MSVSRVLDTNLLSFIISVATISIVLKMTKMFMHVYLPNQIAYMVNLYLHKDIRKQ